MWLGIQELLPVVMETAGKPFLGQWLRLTVAPQDSYQPHLPVCEALPVAPAASVPLEAAEPENWLKGRRRGGGAVWRGIRQSPRFFRICALEKRCIVPCGSFIAPTCEIQQQTTITTVAVALTSCFMTSAVCRLQSRFLFFSFFLCLRPGDASRTLNFKVSAGVNSAPERARNEVKL